MALIDDLRNSRFSGSEGMRRQAADEIERHAAEIASLLATLTEIMEYGGADKPGGARIRIDASAALQMRIIARRGLERSSSAKPPRS